MRDYLTAQEVADLLDVSRSSVYSWVRQGLLHTHRAGKLMRFTAEEVETFLTQTHRGPTAIEAVQRTLNGDQSQPVIIELPADVADQVRKALAAA